jgi:hypothetical protein
MEQSVRLICGAFAVAAVVVAAPLPAQGGGQPSKPSQPVQTDSGLAVQRLQERRMAQLYETVHRISTVCDRAQQTSIQEQRRTQGIWRVSDRQLLMQRAWNALALTGMQLQRLAESVREMQRDCDVRSDPDIQRELDRLEQELLAMTAALEQSFQTLERLRKRLSDSIP